MPIEYFSNLRRSGKAGELTVETAMKTLEFLQAAAYFERSALLSLDSIRVNMLEVFHYSDYRFCMAIASYRIILELLRSFDNVDPKKMTDAVRIGASYFYRLTRGPGVEELYDTMMKQQSRKGRAVLKSCVKLLSLQHRAAVRVNHPARKKARGEFECDESHAAGEAAFSRAAPEAPDPLECDEGEERVSDLLTC